MANFEKKEFIFGSQLQRDERPSPSQQEMWRQALQWEPRASVLKGKQGAERLNQRWQEVAPSDMFPLTRPHLINLSKKHHLSGTKCLGIWETSIQINTGSLVRSMK